jgi:hypothetical protein
MPPAYPNDFAQTVERRWQNRTSVTRPRPTPCNDNAAGGAQCPACDKLGPIAPIVSEYRGNGLIHHHWLCKACGHEWLTAQTVAT